MALIPLIIAVLTDCTRHNVLDQDTDTAVAVALAVAPAAAEANTPASHLAAANTQASRSAMVAAADTLLAAPCYVAHTLAQKDYVVRGSDIDTVAASAAATQSGTTVAEENRCGTVLGWALAGAAALDLDGWG